MNINTKTLLFFLVFLFAFLLSLNQISDFDVWFHLQTGKYIVENRTLPEIDPFSFTAQNNPFQIHDWLTKTIYYTLFNLFNINGLIILNSLILAITFILIFKTALLYYPRKETNFLYYYIAFITTICAVLIARGRFVIRPFIISYFFTALFLLIIRLYKTREKNLLWILPVLMIFWSNMHYGCIFGIAIMVLLISGEFIKWIGRRYLNFNPEFVFPAKKIKHILIITILTILASFINPYGWRFPLYGLQLRNVLLTFPIMEHMAPILHWHPLFISCTFLLLIVWILNIKRIDFSEFLIIFIFLFMSISNVRFISLFAIISAPILAKHLYLTLKRFINISNEKMIKNVNFLIIPVTIITLLTARHMNKHFAFGLGINKDSFPKKAVKFIKDNKIQGNMFNKYAHGGYLNWMLFPHNRVFVDGHLVFYGPNTLQKYNEIVNLHPLWEELLTETRVDLIIYDRFPLLDKLRKSHEWSLIYWDDLVCIYIRNIPKNKELISQYSNKHINPIDKNLDYLKDKERIKINQTIYDIKKKLLQDPECVLAYRLLALCYKMKGNFSLSLKAYKKAYELNPDSAITCCSLGLCYEKMDKEKQAIKYYKKAIKLNPSMDDAYFNLGEIYHKQGQFKKACRLYKKALKYNSWNYNAHNNLGTIYMSWHKYNKAHMEFRTAIGINKELPDAWYNIACLNTLQGNLSGFFYYFKKALSLARNKSKYIDMVKKEPSFKKIRKKKIYQKLIQFPYGRKQIKKN